MTAADFAAAERLPPGEIPVVDCSRSEPTLAAAIHDAATRIGFFHLVGYGIPQALMDQALAVAQRFFALSQTDKASIAVDRTISAVGWPAWRARQRTISRRFSSGVGRSRREDPDLPVGLPSPGRPAIARSACHRPVGLPSIACNRWPAAVFPDLRQEPAPHYHAICAVGAGYWVWVVPNWYVWANKR